VKEHMQKGGKALYVDKDSIFIYNGKTAEVLMSVKEIP